MIRHQGGFTLVELMAVLIIVGTIAATAINRTIPNASFQLQASRDLILASFANAQQVAMNQNNSVQVITTSSSIDIRRDDDNNGVYSAAESITFAGIEYPQNLAANQQLSAANFTFNRLGQTTAANLSLSQSGSSIGILVSASGYVD